MEAKKVSPDDLARATGLTKATIQALYMGDMKRIELATIGKLCKALDCTPNDLFEITPD